MVLGPKPQTSPLHIICLLLIYTLNSCVGIVRIFTHSCSLCKFSWMLWNIGGPTGLGLGFIVYWAIWELGLSGLGPFGLVFRV